MRPIQVILDIAMTEAGYSPVGRMKKGWEGEGMCAALMRAWVAEDIDADEYNDAMKEVEGYLEEIAGERFSRPKDNFLSTVLRAAGRPYDERAQLAIYKDWANRPRGEQ